MYGRFHILLLMLLCSLSACTPHTLREAKQTVQQSDSLWHAGQPYADSAQLAQAHETLGQWALFCPDDYAHACYHYGKLLRAREHPVEAMQCFINATHSHTSDYHILGRVYSNMGTMCHLAGNFPLAYEMYEQSAMMYLCVKDTLLYYYDLNNMAYEVAMQADKDASFSLLEQIEKGCSDDNVLLKTCETKAELYLRCKQYDSALHYAKEIVPIQENSALALIAAQSYSYLGNKDSATLYANIVLSLTNELYEQNNALYILTNDDNSKDIQSIRESAADRADTQKLIEIKKTKLSQAVQLLEQDTQRKPDWRWLYAIIGTIAIIGTGIFIYVRRKQKRHQLLSQQIEDLEHQNKDTLSLRQEQIEATCALLASSPNLAETLSWKDFDQLCLLIDKQLNMFATKLRRKQVLNETEMRLCILVLLKLSRNDIATTLPYALNSIGKLKDQTAKKIGTTGKNLHDFLLKLAVEN